MSSPTLTVDQIAKGDIPQDPDLWIKAGKNYAVPVNIDLPGVVLSWEFSTEPKVIFFFEKILLVLLKHSSLLTSML